jgi:hypothetical protein
MLVQMEHDRHSPPLRRNLSPSIRPVELSEYGAPPTVGSAGSNEFSTSLGHGAGKLLRQLVVEWGLASDGVSRFECERNS